MLETLAAIVAATLAAGTPLVLAGLGELVTERAGVLNLGLEGMMLVGAVCGFMVAADFASLWLGTCAAAHPAASATQADRPPLVSSGRRAGPPKRARAYPRVARALTVIATAADPASAAAPRSAIAR